MGRLLPPQTHLYKTFPDLKKMTTAHFSILASNHQCLLQLCTIYTILCKADPISAIPTKSSANKRPDIVVSENLTPNSGCFSISHNELLI